MFKNAVHTKQEINGENNKTVVNFKHVIVTVSGVQ